jgi:TPR repeat protein
MGRQIRFFLCEAMRTAVETEANRVGAILVRKDPGRSGAIQFAISRGTDTPQGLLFTTDAAETTHYDALCRAVKTGSVYHWESELWVKATSHSAFVTYRTQQKRANETGTDFWTKVRRSARLVLVSMIFLGALAYLVYGRKFLKDDLGILVWPLRGLYIISFLYLLVVGFGFVVFASIDRLYSLYEKLLPDRVPHYGGIEECKKAANSGDAQAQCTLGGFYERGQFGLPQDYAESARWYRKAAEQNHGAAQLNLGVCLGKGQGVERNVVEGLMWIYIAEHALIQHPDRGWFPTGRFLRDGAYQAQSRLEAQMTEQEIAEARAMLDSSPLYKELKERLSVFNRKVALSASEPAPEESPPAQP